MEGFAMVRAGALATDRLLADFHEARSALYEAFGELVESGVLVPRIERGLALAEGDALLDLLRAAPPSALRDEAPAGERAAPARCHDPDDGVRLEAFATASREPGDARVHELGLLAALARLTARALRAGDLVGAAALSGVQGRFLREHAAPCLAAFAADLEGSGWTLHVALGRALARSVARDVALNGAPDGRAPSTDRRGPC